MAENSITSVESVVGHENGKELSTTEGNTTNTEVVVYDYDDNGQFIGWHKEAA